MNRNTFYLIFLVCCGFFIRTKDLSLYDFNYDDYWHLYVANQENLIEVLKKNFQIELHPPFSVILWHYALKISDNQMWLRSFSIIFGLVLIPSFYILGKVYISRFFGYLSSFIATFGFFFVTQSSLIRAYVFMLFCLVWMMILVFRYLKKSKNKYLWLYFIFSFFALGFNHYSCVIIMFLSFSLIGHCYKNKNFYHLKIIILVNLIFLIIEIIYFSILLNQGQEIYNNWGIYLYDNILGSFFPQTIFYLFVSEFYFFNLTNITTLSDILNLLFLFGFFYLIIKFIKEKKWHLLNIVFMPIIFSIIASSFGIIPNLYIPRRISFIFPNQIIVFGFLLCSLKNLTFASLSNVKLFDFFGRCILINCSKTINNFIKFFVILVSCIYMVYSYSINAYSREFLSNIYIDDFVKKKYVELRNLILFKALADDSNIVIVAEDLRWEYLYRFKNSDFKKINENIFVGKFNNKEVFFVFYRKSSGNYFTALIIDDIKRYLLKNNQFDNKKNIVFLENCVKTNCFYTPTNLVNLNCHYFTSDKFNKKNIFSQYEFNFYDENKKYLLFYKVNFR